MNIRLQYEEMIQSPFYFSTSVYPLWPPDGFIMAILMLLFILGCHLVILILVFLIIYISGLRRLCDYLLVCSGIIALSHGSQCPKFLS